MNAVLQKDAEKFADFIQAHYLDAQSWKDPIGYCAWYISHFFIAAVCCEQGHIVAVGAARPVDRPGMGVLEAYYNENGTCLHVDLLIDTCSDNRAIIALKEIAKVRFPQCTTVSMFRRFESQMAVYPAKKFWRNLDKIKKKEKQHELVST